jgi:isoquinoline 1-oxidoreductase beta subunit
MSHETWRGGVHIPGQREIAYSDLVVAAAALPALEDAAPLRSKDSYRIIGTPRKTIDALDIVTGKTKYGIDTIRPDMRYAVIARAPVLNAQVKSFDDAGARAVDGVLDVFKIDGPAPGEPYFILASGIALAGKRGDAERRRSGCARRR